VKNLKALRHAVIAARANGPADRCLQSFDFASLVDTSRIEIANFCVVHDSDTTRGVASRCAHRFLRMAYLPAMAAAMRLHDADRRSCSSKHRFVTGSIPKAPVDVRHFREDSHVILPRIHLGSLGAADPGSLLTKGLTHVVNTLGQHQEPARGIGARYFTVSFGDVATVPIGRYFKRVVAWIDAALAASPDHRVLVHCAAGVSRSASLCIAYVMWKERLRVAQAYELVQSKRTIIDPNEGFREQLVAWDSHLFEGAPWPYDGVSEEELDARVDPAGAASGMFCLAGCCGNGDSSKAATPAAEDGTVIEGAGAMPSPLSAEASSGRALAGAVTAPTAAGAGCSGGRTSHLAIKAPTPPPCEAGASRTPLSASSRAGTPPVRGDVDKAVLGAAAWIIEGRTPTPTSALLGLGLGPLSLSAGGGASGSSTPTNREVERACGLAASHAAVVSGASASGLAAAPAADVSCSTASSSGGGS
jgi:atypical dual specificity phosphatase